jgi:hypothetical protein
MGRYGRVIVNLCILLGRLICLRASIDMPACVSQRVGLVTAPSLRGPWQRAIGEVNPVNLSALSPHIEQPMVTRLRDSRGFVAFFDALQEQGKGMIGYSFSSDGLTVRWPYLRNPVYYQCAPHYTVAASHVYQFLSIYQLLSME